MLSEYLPQAFSLTDLVIRITAAALAGLILGLDRDIKGKPIDFRAYIIICIASAMMAMITQELIIDLPENNENLKLDPYRIIEGVLIGIGFLGAGTIIKRSDGQKGNEVIGTATGASIWATGGLGLAIGFGMYVLAGVAFLGIFLTLCLFSNLMEKIFGNDFND
jgi:putative Mg2+ transporter-C (MgtC) family protein